MMCLVQTNDSISLQVSIASLAVAGASLLISVAATWIAASSLSQAKRVANRDLTDWRQRKWFDLYFKADEAYDALEAFQIKYQDGVPTSDEEQWARFSNDWNELMDLFRRVHSMAVVFPKNAVIDGLLLSSAVFSNVGEGLSKERLKRVFHSVQNMRDQALIMDSAILG
jgi:hypothetical protein